MCGCADCTTFGSGRRVARVPTMTAGAATTTAQATSCAIFRRSRTEPNQFQKLATVSAGDIQWPCGSHSCASASSRQPHIPPCSHSRSWRPAPAWPLQGPSLTPLPLPLRVSSSLPEGLHAVDLSVAPSHCSCMPPHCPGGPSACSPHMSLGPHVPSGSCK